jgi:hypothetical protein
MQLGRQPRFDEPAEPAEEPAGHRPLLAVAVVHQHRDPSAVDQPGQEGQTVLGVDDHVRLHPSQRSDVQPGRRHRQQRPHVDRVSAARTTDSHAVDDFAPRRAGVAGGPQRDVDAGSG